MGGKLSCLSKAENTQSQRQNGGDIPLSDSTGNLAALTVSKPSKKAEAQRQVIKKLEAVKFDDSEKEGYIDNGHGTIYAKDGSIVSETYIDQHGIKRERPKSLAPVSTSDLSEQFATSTEAIWA